MSRKITSGSFLHLRNVPIATPRNRFGRTAITIAERALVAPITFPARPVNGGRFELAPAKRGEWSVEPKLNGWRVLVHAPTMTAFTRHGERLSIAKELCGGKKRFLFGNQRGGMTVAITWRLALR